MILIRLALLGFIATLLNANPNTKPAKCGLSLEISMKTVYVDYVAPKHKIIKSFSLPNWVHGVLSFIVAALWLSFVLMLLVQ